MSDYTELKRLAEAATAGPWSMCGEADGSQGFEIIQDIWNEHGTHIGKDVVVYEWSDESDPLGVIHRADAEFIAAANPFAVLALIADSNRLTTQVRLAGISAEVTVHQEVGRAITETLAVTIERDQLRAQLAGLKTGYEAYERVNAELKAENEALRQVVSDSATSCGAAVSVGCSLDFMAHLPVEIFSVISKLRNALSDLLDLYDADEGCRNLPQYIAGRAAMGKGEPS